MKQKRNKTDCKQKHKKACEGYKKNAKSARQRKFRNGFVAKHGV